MIEQKILVIEDIPINMELVTDLLELAGYKVFQAETAETGIEIARAHDMLDGLLSDVTVSNLQTL